MAACSLLPAHRTSAPIDPAARGGATISFVPAAQTVPDRPLDRLFDRPLRLRAIAPSSRPLRVGERAPGTPFTVRAVLGEGGMGEVYEVELDEGGPLRALKVLHARHRGRADLEARTRREAEALGRFDHQNLVRVFDHGTLADGRPFLLMERLRGRDLRSELVRCGALSATRALGLVAQALEGLAVAHAAGLVHRDIKLENLFLCEDGTLKVLDFGLAKATWAEASLTLPGVCFGTPRTMAPEQCSLEVVDRRADLYAAGLVLFELCTGSGPFDELAGQPEALRHAHLHRAPPRPSRLAPAPLDPGVEAIILRALAKSPEDRFQSAGEMAQALRAWVQAAEAPPPRELGSTRKHRRSWAPALLVGLAATLFALGVAFGRALPAPSPQAADGGALAPSADAASHAASHDRSR
jgi:serine/threonine protein kinase